ncbi:MAG: hypothetical protein ACI9WS_001037 [Paraglaciecola psychrophila]
MPFLLAVDTLLLLPGLDGEPAGVASVVEMLLRFKD